MLSAGPSARGRAVFVDRRAAGAELAAVVRTLPGLRDPIVLALPRGGVPVGYEVARAIGAPLDVLVVRKLGAPGQEELAIGAVASGGSEHLNRELIAALGLSLEELSAIRERERVEPVSDEEVRALLRDASTQDRTIDRPSGRGGDRRPRSVGGWQ